MSEILEITNLDSGHDCLKRDGYFVIECYSYSKASLRIMEPIFEKLRKKHFQFRHLRINSDDFSFIRDRFQIFRTPTYLFFYNKQLVDKVEGVASFNFMKSRMIEHCKKIDSQVNER